MKTIEINEVKSMKAAEVSKHNANRKYTGNAVADQRIEYISRMSDEEYMTMYNQVVRRENLKAEEKADRRAEISEERKSTGMSKKAYRAEYDRLNALYKAGDYSVKVEMKRIQKFAF